jgi:hypothetical protein
VIFVRLFIQGTTIEASEVAARLAERLRIVVEHAQIASVRPYWKITEYQEVCLSLHVVGEPKQQVMSIASRLGSGWTVNDSGEALWNPGVDATFVEPQVRWAHVDSAV